MALAWLPLNDAAIDAIHAIAYGSWKRSHIDSTWRLAGWPAPGDGSVSQLIFERMQYRIDIGDRFVSVRMRFDPDAILALVVDFAVFFAPADPEDPDLVDLVQSFGDRGWLVDATAGRQHFYDAWQQSCADLGGRLGAPALTGHHAPNWRHAAWHAGQRLVILAQGEDFASYSLYDAAYVCVMTNPPAGRIPTGDQLYALLSGDTVDDANPQP